MPMAAIAEVTGVPVGTVKSRALQRDQILREELASDAVEVQGVRSA